MANSGSCAGSPRALLTTRVCTYLCTNTSSRLSVRRFLLAFHFCDHAQDEWRFCRELNTVRRTFCLKLNGNYNILGRRFSRVLNTIPALSFDHN
jgi:hypothetical protein